MAVPHVPLSCYRLQFNSRFTFRDAGRILDYLSRLGITDIYASPILQSRLGSGHGYDVTDPTRIDSDLGSEEQFEAFQACLQKHGMGLLLDIVPNHMAASHENPWWMDVLENGPGSAYAAYFDIDWHPPSRALEGKILLPILGSHYGDTLKNQELYIIFKNGGFLVQYHEALLPLSPKSYRRVLKHRQDILEKRFGEHSPALLEFLGIVAALAALPERESLTAETAGVRRLSLEAIKERLNHLYDGNREFREFLQENLRQFNGCRNDAGSFRLLDRLLSEQAYVLAYWQNVNEGINYRRFFAITDLVGVRVEDPVVFEAMHGIIFHLIEKGGVTGLRLDHMDGLRDPLGYLRRLQERVRRPNGKNSDADFYVVVEKILSGKEKLLQEWPVQGTTGYEYLNAVNRLFVHPSGAKAIERIYCRFLGKELKYEDVLYQKKKLVMSTLLAVEMRTLGRQLGLLAGQDRYARDLPRIELAQALEETTGCLSVYRTYTRSMELCPEAKRSVECALESARARKPHLNPACFDFVRDVLLLKDADHLFPEQREARLAFVVRWQQFTGPIVAKGLEDTALYVYCPLISLNEVGGDPRPANPALMEFSDFVQDRRLHWRYTLNSTSTHDTKRGEDVRARINVLSEIPAEWQRHLNAWARWNAAKKKTVEGHIVPDRNEEIFLYQTLVGAWPLDEKEMPEFLERLQSYVIKATREAMVYTRWTRPNISHEQSLVHFAAAIVKPGRRNCFLADFLRFQQKIAYFGMLNGLSQILLKMTSPGVPDFYQGCDLWDLRLVDPDNRGPIDFEKRDVLLRVIQERSEGDTLSYTRELLENWRDGRIKLYLIWKTLNFRRQYRQLFLEGRFLPLQSTGSRGDSVVAHARRQDGMWVVVGVPRWLARSKAPSTCAGIQKYWSGNYIVLPEGAPDRWQNVLTGEWLGVGHLHGRSVLCLVDAFKHFPLALLSADSHDRSSERSTGEKA